MAGEWLAIDIGLPDEPEVQELIDVTGHPVEYVCFRLYRLWGWASMHCADGTARMTIPRLVRTCGGDDAFWQAVAAVGWLEIDETAATVTIPKWDRRFSQAAKARLQHQDRAKAQNERDPDRRKRPGTACAQAQAPPAPPRSRGEERTGEFPPPPREASQDGPASWETLRDAWNNGPGRKWKPVQAPDGAADRLSEPGWLTDALEAIGRLRACRYFETPVALGQFVKPGFVAKVLGGQYDTPKARPASAGRLDERPPPQAFTGDDAARFEATKRAMASKIREAAS